MKGRTFIFLALFPLCICCKGGGGDEPGPEPVVEETVLSLADPDATPETKALYSNLWAIREKGWMFGHQNDLLSGRTWREKDGGSDTRDVCGDYPAVYGVDVAAFMDERKDTADNPRKRKTIVEAYDRGMVVMACMHLNNPLTGGTSWISRDSDPRKTETVAQILTAGSEARVTFDRWLDNLAKLAESLVGSDGVQIPLICRPFHEHGHEWSWWGNTSCTADQYTALWRYFVDGLKERGVHTFIYAISPAMNNAKTDDDFLFRWPGDGYVDFIGMDCYQGINNNVFTQNLKCLRRVSEAKKKPAGVTETGVQGFTAEDYWITNIAAPMAGRNMSMLVTWTNEYDPMGQYDVYFSVFKGHPSEESFRAMYDREDTFFCGDLPDMYKMADNITVN